MNVCWWWPLLGVAANAVASNSCDSTTWCCIWSFVSNKVVRQDNHLVSSDTQCDRLISPTITGKYLPGTLESFSVAVLSQADLIRPVQHKVSPANSQPGRDDAPLSAFGEPDEEPLLTVVERSKAYEQDATRRASLGLTSQHLYT